MTRLSYAVVLFLLPAAWAAPAFAQAAPAPASREEERAELYSRLLDGRGPAWRQQRSTYETAKEYLRKFGEPEDDIVRYVRGWVLRYEAAVRRFYQSRVPKLRAGPRPVCRHKAGEVPSIPK